MSFGSPIDWDVCYTPGTKSTRTFTIEVRTNADSTDDPDETFNIRVRDQDNGPFDHSFTLTIKEATAPKAPDDIIQMRNTKRSILEVGGEPGAMRVVVEVGKGLELKGSSRTINFTIGGTADRGDGKDYTIAGVGNNCTDANCTVTLPANRHSAVITIHVEGDDMDEPDETVILTLKPGTGYTLNDKKTSTVTIRDNDTRGLLFSKNWVDILEGKSLGSRDAITYTLDGTYTLRLSSEPTAQVDVNIASNNPDVTVTPTTLAFTSSNWNSTQTVTVTVAQDDDAEDEQATLTHTASGGDYGSVSYARTIEVEDDDTETTTTNPLPVIDITGGDPITEGTSASFTLEASKASSSAITIHVEVAEPEGQDFIDASQEGTRTLTLNAGATSATFNIPTVNDSTREEDGWIQVLVNNGTGYTAGTGAHVTIRDNDEPPRPSVSFTTPTSSASEGAGTHNVAVRLSSPAPAGLSVAYGVTGTATQGSGGGGDFSAGSRLNVAEGEVTANIVIQINDDSTDESTETVILTLEADNPSSNRYTLGTPIVHTLTLNDDDAPPSNTPIITITGSNAVTEGTDATFTLNATPAPTANITVNLAVTDGDNFAASGQVGNRTVTIGTSGTAALTVTTDDDSTDEPNGRVTATLRTGTGYSVGSPSSAFITVNDNDVTTNPGPTNPGPTPPTTNPGNNNNNNNNNNNDNNNDIPPPVIPPVSVSAQALTLTEGAMGSYTLVLDSAPTTSVTITITPQDNQRISVSPASVVFTPDNWQTPQSIRVQANADSYRDTQTVQLTHAITDSDQAIDALTVTIQERIIRLSLSSPTQVSEGQSLTLTVTADRTPTVDLPIELQIREITDTDYIEDTQEGTQRILLRAGQDRVTHTLSIRDNDQEDTQEGRITVQIQPHSGYTVSQGSIPIRITDDEAQIPTTPWVSRMGRTLAEQAIDGIRNRMNASRTPGLTATLAGWSVPMHSSSGEFDKTYTHPASSNPAGQTLNAQDIFSNSQFIHTTGLDLRGGNTAFWGHLSETDFSGTQHDLHTQGESRTLNIGADYVVHDWMTGISLLSNSTKGTQQRQAITERMESNLTALIPYSARETGETRIWGAAGFGQGTVSRYREDRKSNPSDVTWQMLNLGVSREIRTTETATLSLDTDALWVRTQSDESRQDNMNPSISRIRAGLQSTWNHTIQDTEIQPSLTVGVRHDGGGAESGFGLYAGSGLHWTSATVQMDIEGQVVLSHQQEIEESGFSASLIHDAHPHSDLGFSLSLSQASLLTIDGLDSWYLQESLMPVTDDSRWSMDAAYGLSAWEGRFTGSPHIGLGLSGDSRDIQLGWRMTPLATNQNLSLGIQATRLTQEQTAPKHWFGVEVRVRW